jgi:endoglucanase
MDDQGRSFDMQTKTQTTLPRWRGFNLLEMFTTRSSGDFREDDFRWMADWGFNFARIPACYTLWIADDDVYTLHEPMLEKLDRVVELGQAYDIHISLNFHRGPGYSVNREREEPFNLWKDSEALDAFIFHWTTMAKRYAGIPSTDLSFDLINEPPRPEDGVMTREDHERVVRATVAAIREIDPDRLILADCLGYGRIPMPELVDLGIAQSCRAYEPMGISHYKASWVNGEDWPTPTWPGGWHYGGHWDRKDLEALYAPWIALAEQGVGVHCGEGGAFNQTPHDVVLAWFRDVLEILTAHNIGYALWNFRGSFGILDSGREDVAYEDWHGHKLDRELLALLQAF